MKELNELKIEMFDSKEKFYKSEEESQNLKAEVFELKKERITTEKRPVEELEAESQSNEN